MNAWRVATNVRQTAANAGQIVENNDANGGMLRRMEEILRWTAGILAAGGGVEAEGVVGGDKGNVQVDGGVLEADRGDVEVDGVVCGRTRCVWADKGCCSGWGREDFSI